MHLTIEPKNCEAKTYRTERINKSATIITYFNTLLSLTERRDKQKISKDMNYLNSTISKLNLMGIYRIFHPTQAKYTFF